MADTQKMISPVDGSTYVERPLATASEIDAALARAEAAQKEWKRTPLADRAALLTRATDAFVARKDDIATEISFPGENIREIPKTLREAIELLDRSTVLRKALGDDVVDHYVHTGRWEQAEFDRRVTDWEVVRNFERA